MTGRKFGVEVEFVNLWPEAAARALTEAGIPCEFMGYTHGNIYAWKIVTDASVSPQGDQVGCGLELVTPPLRGQEGFDQLTLALNTLAAAGAQVNRTCGLHVHFDASNLTVNDVRNVINRYAKFETEIDLMQPTSRRGSANRYCQSLRSNRFLSRVATATTINQVVRSMATRFHKVNLHSIMRHGTLEFRQHSGTLNPKKVVAWVKFCLAFIEASRSLTGVVTVASTLPSYMRRGPARPGSKAALLIDLCSRPGGATMQEMLEVTGWRECLRTLKQEAAKRGLQVVMGTTYTLAPLPPRPAPTAGNSEDHVYQGVDEETKTYLEERRRALATGSEDN